MLKEVMISNPIKKTEIAILIPVFNGLRYTSSCLSCLYHMKYSLKEQSPRIRIIVTDDGSTDGTMQWIKLNYPETDVLEGDGNLWWSGAINLGIRYALEKYKSDFVLWWNNDIVPASDYLECLLGIIDNEDICIAGSKIYYSGREKTIWSMGGLFDPKTGKKVMIGMNEQDSEIFNQTLTVDWLPGMGTLIHHSVFEKIGFVDDACFLQYHGDSDFTFRANLSGIIIKVFPQLKIWNDKSNSGYLHENNFKQLRQSLTSKKSIYNISQDIKFYRKYSTSIFAYKTLVKKYCYYIGGFFKWKVLNMLGFVNKRM